MPEENPISRDLRQIREDADLTVRKMAQLLDMAPGTYQHYESTYKKDQLDNDFIIKLLRILPKRGIEPQRILRLRETQQAREAMEDLVRRSGLSESDLVEYRPRSSNGAIPPQDLAQRLYPGHNNASVWRITGRALEMAGYLPGDLVVVDLDRKAARGDAVCAQIYDLDNDTAQTVLRLFEPPYLVAASSRAEFRKPDLVDDERVKIMGVVVASVRQHVQPGE